MFWQLFGAYGLLVLGAIGALGIVIVNRVEQYERHAVEENLRTRAVLVHAAVRDRLNDEPALQKEVSALGQAIQTRITVIAEPDGRVLADSESEPKQMKPHDQRPEVNMARGSRGFGADSRRSETLGEQMMYVALRREEPDRVVFVRVALPLATIDERLAELRRIVWTAAALTGMAAMALAFWLARRVTRPLQELTTGAQRIAAGDYHHKVYAVGRDEFGTLARAFNHMSERLAAQFAQLEQDGQQLRAVLSGMVEGVVAIDAGQRILFANDRAAQLLGFQSQAATGRKLWEVVRQRALHEVVRRALASAEPYQEELNWNSPVVKSLTVHAAPLAGEPDQGAVLVLHDTSDLRRLERLRRDFVANVSHELKTPLSVIKACVETLVDGAIDDHEHRDTFLQQVADQADRLHNLILDLLSLARIESGVEVFDFQEVPLGPLVTACLQRHQARAEAKHQVVEAVPSSLCESAGVGTCERPEAPAARPRAHSPPPSPSHSDVAVWADAEAVSEILDNLVDNAVKYTPDCGRIAVRWGAADGQVWLEIADTGIGIPEHDLPRIFERFYRVDKARSREMGGTGLGLSIVKHLVQAMHGTIGATSRVGEGTTFTIRLPQAPSGLDPH
jgi:two-component system phosphate regulon sensor histidine kinase PhoR